MFMVIIVCTREAVKVTREHQITLLWWQKLLLQFLVNGNAGWMGPTWMGLAIQSLAKLDMFTGRHNAGAMRLFILHCHLWEQTYCFHMVWQISAHSLGSILARDTYYITVQVSSLLSHGWMGGFYILYFHSNLSLYHTWEILNCFLYLLNAMSTNARHGYDTSYFSLKQKFRTPNVLYIRHNIN